jgi:hypothetical protein
LLKGHLERDIRLDHECTGDKPDGTSPRLSRQARAFFMALEISKEWTLGDSIEKFVERGRDQGAPRPGSVASDEKLRSRKT